MTVEYFKSLGAATEPDPHTEIANCFKIGYHDGGDAMRAVRKNGEVLGGSFMIGTKWAVGSSCIIILILVVLFLTFSLGCCSSRSSSRATCGALELCLAESK